MNVRDLREKYLQPIKEWWDKQEKKKRLRMMIIAGVMLVLIVALVVFLNYQPYTTLFSDLEAAELSEILQILQDTGIDARVVDSDTILVPKNQEAMLKMRLATEGYPRSGFSYDIYLNNVDAMTTDSDRRTYLAFQLQERIQQAVQTISGVQKAVVTLALPDTGSFVLSQNQSTPTASVVVTMTGGEELSSAQVNGVKQLVAKGVPGMDKDEVAVINSATGNEMGSDVDSASGRATDKMAIEKQIDTTIENKVSEILRPLVGGGYATVVATSRVSTDSGVIQSTTYYPSPEDGTTGVTASESHYLEGANEELLASGVPGAETNADIPTYEELVDADGNGYFVNKYDYNYYVSEVKEQMERSDVVIESIGISVVIFSDVLTEMDQMEIQSLVARTANVQEEDVYVLLRSVEASPEQPTGVAYLRANWWILVALGALLLLIIIVIVVILLSKRRRKTMEDMEKAAQEEEMARQLGEITSIPIPEESQQQKLARQIKSFADEHPEIAAQLIRSWLKGDE
jgi:flagellar M-ring protein FliF